MRIVLGVLLAAALVVAVLPADAPAGDGGFKKAALENGMGVISRECGGGVAAACIFIRAGAADEDAESRGLTSLLNRTLLSCQPMGGVDPPLLKIEQMGGSLSALTLGEFSCFRLAAPADNFEQALAVLAGALSMLDCSKASVERERDALQALAYRKDDKPAERAYAYFLEMTYDGLGYGMDPDGYVGSEGRPAASIAGLGPADIAGLFKKRYMPGNMLVSVCAGDSADYGLDAVAGSFGTKRSAGSWTAGAWPGGMGGPVKATARYDAAIPDGMAVAVTGYTAPPVGSEDFPAVKLIEVILADGMSSRIFRALRVEDDLAYAFGSVLPERRETSRLSFYVLTGPEKIEKALGRIVESVEALKNGDLEADELEKAKGRAAGSLRLDSETALEKAFRAGLYELYGLPPGYDEVLAGRIRKLGAADVARAAAKYLVERTTVVLKPRGDGLH